MTSSGWTRQHRCEYRQTTVQEPWGATDDNNRKPICRLHFNRKQRYLGLFNPEKQETRVRLDDLNDIFTHADRLRATVSSYEALDDATSRAGVTDNQ